MDFECGGFTFVSNFDSGNLARVELVSKKQNEHQNPGKNSHAEEIPDFEFNIWTKPDCVGTEFENSYRTWFYFGVKGGSPFVLVKLNIVNLNRQAKMYSQGMAPVFRMVPGRSHWDRIKEKPSYTVDDKVFILSFKYRTLENIRATTYFAFTYPYTYVELQKKLNSVDARFGIPSSEFQTPKCLDDIYYHRECVCYSLEGRMVDLITVSSYHNMSSEREIRLKHLFPMVDVPRPFLFHGKKVIFVSARVHPGETPSSFVLNGLLNLLLARDDPMAILLRQMYVFKLIPMLNPDGVSQGHYRTDTRGVNLNRMYLNPVFELHPSIYAARSLIRYYHHGQEIQEELTVDSVESNACDRGGGDVLLNVGEQDKLKCDGAVTVSAQNQDKSKNMDSMQWLSDTSKMLSIESKVSGLSLDEKQKESSLFPPHTSNSADISLSDNSSNMVLLDKQDVFSTVCDGVWNTVDSDDATSNHSNGTISVISESLPENSALLAAVASIVEAATVPLCTSQVDGKITNSVISSMVTLGDCLSDTVPNVCQQVPSTNHSVGCSCQGASADMNSKEDCQHLQHEGEGLKSVNSQGSESNSDRFEYRLSNLVHSKMVTTVPEDAGLYLYVDLHGHASKKGIFMYGNYFEDLEDSIECMLLPKIMSLNSPNFHFTACNFTERIMYLRDRHGGMSREGSGRVAVLKTTGLVHSYTLECNYNTGKLVNVLPPCMKEGKSPSAQTSMVPPKYTPQVFEEVGRALGISILDLTGSNPWSRIPNSEFRSLSGIRDWLKINCLPEPNCVHKMMQDQKQGKCPSFNAQVGGMPVMSNGVPPPLKRSSGRKNRLTNNKCEANCSRTRRLAPLVTTSSESKVGSVKVPSSSHHGIPCHADLKAVKDGVENVGEDSERKENVSIFQVGSCSQPPSCAKVAKAFLEPKENIGPCSSQRCPGTSKKFKNIQGSGSGVLKQVLTVQSKCATLGVLAGGSKMAKGGISGGMQRITTVGSMTVAKKTSSPTDVCIAKFRKSSVIKLSQGASQEERTCLETHSTKSMSECLGQKGCNHDGVGIKIAKSCLSGDKTRCAEDEQKSISDQNLVKQGPKRLKISAFKTENTCGNLPISEGPCKNDVLINKVKLKEIYTVKVGKEKKSLNKCNANLKSKRLGDDAESSTLSLEGDLLWDSNQNLQNISLGSSYQNGPKLRGKVTRKKQIPRNSSAKSIMPVTRTFVSGSRGTGSGNKVMYSTKSEKQGKGQVLHLSPIRTLQKRKNVESSRKLSQVSLRSCSTSVSAVRASSGESHQSIQLEKKRKKLASKFL